MTKESFEKLVISLEGLKLREWEDIKEHIDMQFETQHFNATKEIALVIDKDYLERRMDSMRSLTYKSKM